MWCKGTYTLKATANEPIEWWSIDYIQAGKYSFDVTEIDGMNFEGKEINVRGSTLTFTVYIDGEEAVIDWDDLQENMDQGLDIGLIINDEMIDYDLEVFQLSIFDDYEKYYGEIKKEN